MSTRSKSRKSTTKSKSSRPQKQPKIASPCNTVEHWFVETWTDLDEIPDSNDVLVEFHMDYNNAEMEPYNMYEKYEGEWKNGAPHGEGTIYYIPNSTKPYQGISTYYGQIRNGFAHGNGTMTCGRFKWTGRWRNGERNGLFLTETETTVYEGEYRNGEKHGFGKLTQKETNMTVFGKWNKGIRAIDLGVKTEGLTFFGPLNSNHRPIGQGIIITDDCEIYFGMPNGTNPPKKGYYIQDSNVHLYDDENGDDHIIYMFA